MSNFQVGSHIIRRPAGDAWGTRYRGSLGDPNLNLAIGDPVKLFGAEMIGSDQVQNKSRVALDKLIANVNDLFEGESSVRFDVSGPRLA